MDFGELDGDAISYSIVGDSGFTLSTDTATKIVTISGVPVIPGNYAITVVATDIDGTASDTFSLR